MTVSKNRSLSIGGRTDSITSMENHQRGLTPSGVAIEKARTESNCRAHEPRPVSTKTFETTSAPMINSAAKRLSSLLDRARPRWGGGRVGEVIDLVKDNVDRLEEVTHETAEAFEMFRPFTVENAYIFRSDNLRSLFSRIATDEESLLVWNPEAFDWYDYWLTIHLPGLKKWVFPTLEEDMRVQPKRSYTYRDLLEPSRLQQNVTRRGWRCA